MLTMPAGSTADSNAPGAGRLYVSDIALAAACLTATTIALRVIPLKRILRFTISRQKALRPDGRDHMVMVTRLVRALATVGAVYVGRALCLERSLALYTLLTIKGVCETELHIGVTPYGFAAHAWVSYRGQLLNERPDKVKEFVPFSLS